MYVTGGSHATAPTRALQPRRPIGPLRRCTRSSLHAVIAVTSRGRRWLPPRHLPRRGLLPSAHGIRRAAGFFLAYFEYRRRISTGNLHGPPGRRRSRRLPLHLSRHLA
jgi:hypothetical protein